MRDTLLIDGKKVTLRAAPSTAALGEGFRNALISGSNSPLVILKPLRATQAAAHLPTGANSGNTSAILGARFGINGDDSTGDTTLLNNSTPLPHRKIVVGGLNHGTDDAGLLRFFSKFGIIEAAEVRAPSNADAYGAVSNSVEARHAASRATTSSTATLQFNSPEMMTINSLSGTSNNYGGEPDCLDLLSLVSQTCFGTSG